LKVETVPDLGMCYFSSRERERERSKIDLLCGIIWFRNRLNRVKKKKFCKIPLPVCLFFQKIIVIYFVFSCQYAIFELSRWPSSPDLTTSHLLWTGFKMNKHLLKRQPNSHVLRSGVLFLFRGALLYQSPHTEVTNLHSNWISCAEIHFSFSFGPFFIFHFPALLV